MAPDEIRRLRGGRTRAELARLLGVEQLTIYRWELPLSAKESRRPRGKQLESLLAFARAEEGVDRGSPREPQSPSAPPPLPAPGPGAYASDGSMSDGEEAIVLPALASLDDARWEAAEEVLLGAIASGDVVSVEARALAALGMAQAKLCARLDPRGALAVLMPVLAEADAGRLPVRAMARTYAVATMVHATPDPLLLDLAKVNGYASRAVAALGDDEPARDLAAIVRSSQICAAGAAGDMALASSIESNVSAELDATGSSFALTCVAAARSMAAAARGDLPVANRWIAIAVERASAIRVHSVVAVLLTSQAGNALRHGVAPADVLEILGRARTALADGRLIATETRIQIPAFECEAFVRMGRFEEAERAAQQSMDLAREAGSPPTHVSLSYARLLAYRGRAAELGPLIERLERSNVPAAVDRAMALRSLALHAFGDHLRAVEMADELVRRTSRGFVGPDALVVAALRPYGARVFGRVREGREEAAAHARRTLERHPSVWHSALLTRFDGTVLLEDGRGEEAMLRLEASLATFVLAGDVLEAALGRLALAAAATALGHEDAAARREACAKEYEALGLVIPPNAVWNPFDESRRNAPPSRARSSLVDRVLVAVERLAVPGLPAQLLRRELVSGLDQLLGDRRVSIGAPASETDRGHDGGAPSAGHPVDWLEIPDGAGSRLRLSFSGELTREERSAVRAVVLAAGVAFENAAFRGLGDIGGDDDEGAGPDASGFVAVSTAMRRLGAELARLASSGSTVLLAGESGTGKDVVARRLHDLSPRRAAPFAAFNCATVPRELFEGQLFGYRRGSFTGATGDHPGVLRAADGGTVFLDEIGELPLDVQPKLLRFLENREVLGLGDTRATRVDVRVVAATHRDLARLVADGSFRADLFYRLHVVPLRIPPLRERPDDVPALARHFLSRLTPAGSEIPTLGPDAIATLRAHDWPGNARELRNVLERAMAFAPPPKVLRAHHLRIDRPAVPAHA
ncbi:MAG: sigma 54-interacting transcriptional regulator [Deltaproteobacteria bacterium]|nr:sigma 54-interacting transcriptional regulator [Deltaproteobacteria bacterium]